MKTKYFTKIMILALMVSIFSCDTDDQAEVLNDANTAGALVSVSATPNSSILGQPEPGVDLDDALVEITNAYLNMTVSSVNGSMDNISKIQIVKSYNGGEEAVAGESTTLPFNLEIDNLTDLLSGTGVVEDDLRIGGVLLLRTKVFTTDGNVYYYSTGMGNYSMVVNCSSNLAGLYYNPAVPAACNADNLATVTEVSPGRYFVSSMSDYNFVPDICIGFYMIDVCGVLTYDGGDLEDNGYSGAPGHGIVNADGSFTFTAYLDAASYEGTSTYVPVP
ncbi:hypothetical protein OS188_07910 [Xanthomarina sp. F1114]|uniref:hypothetical protein n=1 Tax=Xanthomarina sp. F1114 TaxID=2996019 RepID=UPI00225E1E3D|nr:hypothetical protein [Xanthomarina sp. F1114]MCX7547875.1 hypothetical protein [Xanthomarina sp. F1114]